MSYLPSEIANEFLALSEGNLTQMQVQKLTYIAHGWNWAVNGAPLTSETPKAWAYGPVYPSLYEHTKYFGRSPIGRQITPDDNNVARFFGGSGNGEHPYKAALSPAEKAVIEHVWRRYGKLDAIRLSELTHQPNTPWFNAYRSGKNSSLSEQEIRQHYVDMAERANARNAAHPAT